MMVCVCVCVCVRACVSVSVSVCVCVCVCVCVMSTMCQINCKWQQSGRNNYKRLQTGEPFLKQMPNLFAKIELVAMCI